MHCPNCGHEFEPDEAEEEVIKVPAGKSGIPIDQTLPKGWKPHV